MIDEVADAFTPKRFTGEPTKKAANY